MSLAGTWAVVRQAAVRLVLPLALLYAIMVGLGLLITRVLDDVWPLTLEDDVNRRLEDERGGAADAISLVFSTVASTQVIILVTAIVALVLALTRRDWREPAFLIGAVAAQSTVFVLTTLVIDRGRPAVEHMDASPPTSSFPSGHTSAAIALYVGLGLVLASRAASRRGRWTWLSMLVAVPIGVALARMYRGMHHPSDLIGSVLNGATCLVIMARNFLDRGVRWGRDGVSTARETVARSLTLTPGRPR
ncbi:phosphatase PAP2 family protein [Catenuloplanes atrovinosus]|uniref:Undecaprenyl-diphosphatase n=1 Tax=Catenuloplanes atrovinosus TaxID=137266 RepID=A0AAE4C864_9ACTN|nr:phosphatase PAP2 family protein [Catenuloplanes atrovinosus]MDR7274663.1 undecaprenyl-diphosphatase [Catenuloplanes atrovinosus]